MEEKTALLLPRGSEVDWAERQIYDRTVRRLKTIRIATKTWKHADILSPYIGPDTPPTADQLRKIKNIVFVLMADTPELRKAVAAEIKDLEKFYAADGYTFKAEYPPKP